MLAATWRPQLAWSAGALHLQVWAPSVAEADEAADSELVKLRSAMLGCVARLSVQLHDAQHLLEVLGGLAARAAAGGTSPGALLACMLAAAGTLGELQKEVRASVHALQEGGASRKDCAASLHHG